MSVNSTAGDTRISDLDPVSSVLPGDLVPLARGVNTLVIQLQTLITLAQGAPGAPGRDWRPDGYGPLTDPFVLATEQAGEPIIYIVDPGGDQRADLDVPLSIAGDQGGCAVGWRPDGGWVSYGPLGALPGPVGPGVPAGGSAGQILEKINGSDYNTRWIAPSAPAWGAIVGNLAAQQDLAQALNARASKTSPNVFGGRQTFDAGVSEKHVALTDGTIDLALGNYFSMTVNSPVTFSVQNEPTGVASFVLELTNGGVYPPTWFSGVTFPGGRQPILTAAGDDVLVFFKLPGSKWRGFLAAEMK
ncbi:hypothetical protein ACMHYJ_01980 [Castellaniella hirudinis]|uniref:hypothetical protein n=1 Tax=Castellaniella hirudinis TaxID=1144617 RepID=UPI0039C05EBA